MYPLHGIGDAEKSLYHATRNPIPSYMEENTSYKEEYTSYKEDTSCYKE